MASISTQTNEAPEHTVRSVTEIDYIAERGLGPWLRRRREKKGMTVADLAQAASVGTRTVSRYENDQGLGYETLRMLDALGIKWSAGPLKDSPASVNRELRELRLSIEALRAEGEERFAAVERRLGSLEEKVQRSVDLTSEALLLLREVARPDVQDPPESRQANGG